MEGGAGLGVECGGGAGMEKLYHLGLDWQDEPGVIAERARLAGVDVRLDQWRLAG